MRQVLTYTTSIIALAIELVTGSAFAQTSAAGPYYATPSWDQTLPVATRFIVLSNLNNQAVLDRETGLVWERSPDTTATAWALANNRCHNMVLGNRKGWRLPALQELLSLVDPSVPVPGPTVPSGNPFQNVQSTFYWSATATLNGNYYQVLFVNSEVFTSAPTFPGNAWCVRGGQVADVQ